MDFLRKIKTLIGWIISPVSKDEDASTREFILNILVLGIIITATICIADYEIISFARRSKGIPYHGASSLILYSALLTFISILTLSKMGKSKFAAYCFVGILFAFAIYIALTWGVYAPQGLLVFALVIVVSGILIGVKFLSFFSFFSFAAIFILFEFQNRKIISFDSSWMTRPIYIWDILVYVGTLFVIYSVSWLFNHQIKKSLNRARKSEAELKNERDLLEVKVMERTEELRKAQYEKLRQLYRFAEFGRLSSGLFHDLTNYLTALSLNLEKAKTDTLKESKNVYGYLKRAFNASDKIEDFVEAMQKQLQKQEVKKNFSVKREINHVIQIFNYRMKKEKVKIFFRCESDFLFFGNPLKFNQVITNILSNAIDSFLNIRESREKRADLNLNSDSEDIIISVKDNGCGISEKNLEKIFNPFFTTKDPDYGTGIGLSTTKEIIENNFQGKIEIISQENKGTSVRIIIPKKWNEQKN